MGFLNRYFLIEDSLDLVLVMRVKDVCHEFCDSALARIRKPMKDNTPSLLIQGNKHYLGKSVTSIVILGILITNLGKQLIQVVDSWSSFLINIVGESIHHRLERFSLSEFGSLAVLNILENLHMLCYSC